MSTILRNGNTPQHLSKKKAVASRPDLIF